MKYNGNHYHRIFYVATIYSLLLYLCRYSLEEIKNTLFIFGYGIPEDIAKRFENSIFLHENSSNNWFIAFCHKHRWLQWIEVWYYWFIKIPSFEGHEELYAQDHLLLSGFMCFKPFILVEDGANYIKNNTLNGNVADCRRIREKPSYTLRKLLFGPASMMCYGDNPYCTKILLTKTDDSEQLKDIEQELIDIRKYWETTSKEKRQYILGIYDMKEEDIDLISSKSIIFFTQPLYIDGVPEEELISLTRKILSKYNHKDVVIKTHPRDVLNYRKEFPDILVFDKRIPSQLFDATGVKFEKAVTICSTAACNFDYPIEVDWYGTEVSESIYSIYGSIGMPDGAHHCSL